MNIYTDLTNKFNAGRVRCILSSGQALVLHGISLMSKDGDWIVREDDEALNHILHVLERCGARCRFGAPLDTRWLAGGWSSHFEFMTGKLRIRTDFVSRPPRISKERLARIWVEHEKSALPFVDLEALADLKKTNREKDYAIIGELARRITDVESRLLYSRSAKDILELYARHPEKTRVIMKERGITQKMLEAQDALEAALDAERRMLMHANERRLSRYAEAAHAWSEIWNDVARDVGGLSLLAAHTRIKERAETVLPYAPAEGGV